MYCSGVIVVGASYVVFVGCLFEGWWWGREREGRELSIAAGRKAGIASVVVGSSMQGSSDRGRLAPRVIVAALTSDVNPNPWIMLDDRKRDIRPSYRWPICPGPGQYDP